jgi:predicted amidophosphoribosyltransferase
VGAPRTTSRFEPATLPFSAFYVYWPHAPGATAEASRRLCERVKASNALWLPRYAGCVCRARISDPQLAGLFAPHAVLVPVPGCAGTRGVAGSAFRLAAALCAVGAAQAMWPGLWRRYTVPKSATASSGARPTVHAHYESLELDPPPGLVSRIVLIDDVVTKGRTLLAAAARLRTVLPHADVRAFALVRTLGVGQPVRGRIIALCHGQIRWSGEDARREP